MSVEVGSEPPNRRHRHESMTATLQPLVDAAVDSVGEWVSMPQPDGVRSQQIHSYIRPAIAKALADITVQDGAIYLRIRLNGREA